MLDKVKGYCPRVKLTKSKDVVTGEENDADISDQEDTSFRKRKRSVNKETAVPRLKNDGRGWSFQKFHILLHLPYLITHFAAPMNFDTGRSESNHKVTAKNPAAIVRKRHSTFVKDTSQMLHDQIILKVAQKKFKLNGRTIGNNSSPNKVSTGTRYTLEYSSQGRLEDRWDHVSQVWHTKSKAILELKPAVIRFLSLHVRQSRGEIQTNTSHATEYTHKESGKTMRAHPNYMGDGEWADWIKFDGIGDGDEKDYRLGMLCSVITAYGDEVLGEPELVMRLCSMRDEVDEDFESTILTRWSKAYANGFPDFCIVKS
jgi:hypothetical protein